MHYKNYLLFLLITVQASCASKRVSLLNEGGTINPDGIIFVKDYVEPEETFPTGSALIDSAGEGKLDLLKSFIKYVEVNHRTRYGTTALMSSAKYAGNQKVTLFLIESGADLDAQANNGNTALINAVQSAHTHIVKLLIESGANVNLRNKAGMSAIEYAKKKGFVDMISLLKENGALN